MLYALPVNAFTSLSTLSPNGRKVLALYIHFISNLDISLSLEPPLQYRYNLSKLKKVVPEGSLWRVSAQRLETG